MPGSIRFPRMAFMISCSSFAMEQDCKDPRQLLIIFILLPLFIETTSSLVSQSSKCWSKWDQQSWGERELKRWIIWHEIKSYFCPQKTVRLKGGMPIFGPYQQYSFLGSICIPIDESFHCRMSKFSTTSSERLKKVSLGKCSRSKI